MSQTIWLDRDNTIDMALLNRGVPQNATSMTSWSFHLYPLTGGADVEITSAASPDAFDSTTSMLVGGVTVAILRLKMGHELIPAGAYKARVVGYDAGHTQGIVWGEFLVTARS